MSLIDADTGSPLSGRAVGALPMIVSEQPQRALYAVVTVSKDKVTCIAGDTLESCTASSLPILMNGGYVTPDFFNFIQDVFSKIGETNLPSVVHVHDKSSCSQLPDILENLFNPCRVFLVANNTIVIHISNNNKNPRNPIERNKYRIHGQAEEIYRRGSSHVDSGMYISRWQKPSLDFVSNTSAKE